MQGTGREAGEIPVREMAGAGIGVVALCFLMNMLARGLGESFAVFLLPVTEDLGWSRSGFSSVYAVYMVSQGLSAPVAGALFDRFGARAVWTPSLLLFGGGLLIASVMTEFWHAVIGPGLMVGAGVAGSGMAVGAGLISRWFRRSVTLAMGGAYAGLSVGMITIAPLAQLLIETEGWRFAYRVMGLGLVMLAPLLMLLPWGRISGGRWAAPPRPRSFFIRREILGQSAFLGLFGALFFTSISTWAVLLQAVAYLTERGFSPLTAATAYGAVGAMSIAGVIGTGWLADRYGRRRVMTASYMLSIAGVLVLWSLQLLPALAMLVLFVAVFGVNMGSRGPVVSALCARLYPANVGAVYGTVTIGLGLGSAAGGFASGLLHDLTGGYDAIFALSIVTALLALAPFWLVRPIAEGRWPEEAERGEAAPR
ncbi:MAG: MFS transporter [Pseudomonadota bacterium]